MNSTAFLHPLKRFLRCSAFLACTLALFASCRRDSNTDKFRIGFSQCCDDAWRDVMNREIYRELSFYPELEFEIRVANGNSDLQLEQIRELAKFPIVLCKVSGMVTEADQAHWKAADFTAYLDVVFEAFGEERVMFGSDWPVCLLAGGYARVFGLLNDYAAQFSAPARAKLFGGNAARFYGITA